MYARADLTKGHIDFGKTPVEYETAAMSQFAPYEKRPQKAEPAYKNYNQTVDIITGQIKDKNLKQFGFEKFTENTQRLQSSNKTVFPQDMYVHDPIAHRNIMRKQL